MPETDPYREDVGLVRDAVAGDERSRRAIAERLACVDRMLRSRNNRTGRCLDGHELEDLAQEVRATVWRRLADYRPTAALSSWVFGICEFHLRNAVRGKRRRPATTEYDDASDAERAGGELKFFDHVYRGIEELEPLDQHIVRLKHFDGLTLEEAAVVLDMKLNTLKSRYFRALKRLRVALGQCDEGDV